MSSEGQKESNRDEEFIEIDLKSEPIITDEKIIANLEQIILHLRRGNTYTYRDKEMLMYHTEEYVTGDRKPLDPEILKYLFTGWFIHTNCSRPDQ